MKHLLIDRRTFVAGAGAAFVASIPPAGAERLLGSDVLYASAFQDRDGNHGFAVLDEGGRIISRHALPARGHGVASSSVGGRNVLFARRPGNFAVAFDATGQEEPVLFKTPDDRHFYGHGVFSPDGGLLYATENDFESSNGIIGIYDVSNGFERVAEFPSFGIGPHDIELIEDGKTLCVANGGIKTHPDFGRAKLNLDAMRPNIAFIDRVHGTLLQNHEPPEAFHRLSLRHMAVDRYGTVWIGAQFEGDAMAAPPLIARLSPGGTLELIHLPGDKTVSLRNYIGSVQASLDGKHIAFSAPKGNRLLILNASDEKLLDVKSMPGVCGIAASRQGFMSSTETGRIGNASHPLHWDNHLEAVVGGWYETEKRT